MRFAIFCLLAFSVFETVLADQFQQDLHNLKETSGDKVNDILNDLLSAVQSDVEAAEKKGINTGGQAGCLKSFIDTILTFADPRLAQLDNCYDKATQNQDIKLAQDCFSDTVSGLAEEAKLSQAFATKCIAKCAHTNCSKKTKNQDSKTMETIYGWIML